MRLLPTKVPAAVHTATLRAPPTTTSHGASQGPSRTFDAPHAGADAPRWLEMHARMARAGTVAQTAMDAA